MRTQSQQALVASLRFPRKLIDVSCAFEEGCRVLVVGGLLLTLDVEVALEWLHNNLAGFRTGISVVTVVEGASFGSRSVSRPRCRQRGWEVYPSLDHGRQEDDPSECRGLGKVFCNPLLQHCLSVLGFSGPPKRERGPVVDETMNRSNFRPTAVFFDFLSGFGMSTSVLSLMWCSSAARVVQALGVV